KVASEPCCGATPVPELEHLPQYERGREIRCTDRFPSQAQVGVDLELISQEEMQCRTACASTIHRLVASHVIQRPENRLVIEQADLEHIAQKRVAELNSRAGQLAREVGRAEGSVQVDAERLLVGEEHLAGQQCPAHLPPELVPTDGHMALVVCAQPNRL